MRNRTVTTSYLQNQDLSAVKLWKILLLRLLVCGLAPGISLEINTAEEFDVISEHSAGDFGTDGSESPQEVNAQRLEDNR